MLEAGQVKNHETAAGKLLVHARADDDDLDVGERPGLGDHGVDHDLDVHALPFGRVGGLLCWENYMPLARVSLYESGERIHLAPTADASDGWQATIRHIAAR